MHESKLLVATFGGVGWIKPLRKWERPVTLVKPINPIHPQHHFAPGYGQTHRGSESTLILLELFQGHTFLVVVDAYSKWPEVAVMSSTTSEKTINGLRTMFAQHGLPEQFISDNGPQFTSSEFHSFFRTTKLSTS